MIPFNIPYKLKEFKYLKQCIDSGNLSGDGFFTKKCVDWIKNELPVNHALLTTSCSSALELSAFLSNINPGDEVIMPSYTFVSTANAFVLRGAKIVFVDIRPDTMNIDENLIESSITDKTKAIVPVHYAGISCEMDKIMEIAKKYNLFVIEDAAQGLMSSYKGKSLGTIGDIGCYSFHETKNYTMGEGGAVLFNNFDFMEKAEIIREKGTDRSKFIRGQIDKYTWVDVGGSLLPSDINAAYLLPQLEIANEINEHRIDLWNLYYENLQDLANDNYLKLPYVPNGVVHNGHMFYIKTKNIGERTELIKFLKDNGIQAVFHYIPLHTAPAGLKYGRFDGEDRYTTKESDRLLRLPMFYDLTIGDVKFICSKIKEFYKSKYY